MGAEPGQKPHELHAAVGHIERRVTVIRLTDEAAEFLTRNGYWVDIQRMRSGWRVRVYRGGAMNERVAPSVVDAIEAARSLAR